MLSLGELREKLEALSSHAAKFEKKHNDKLTEAAVLVPIIVQNGVPSVLLTVRSMDVRMHPGHVSFPGGKRDPEDSSLVATALRETVEEIGLSEDHLIVLGSLLPYVIKENIIVTPVVAQVLNFENFCPKLNPFEVCETFTVPLENFIKKECHKCRSFTNQGKNVTADYFEFSQEDNVHIIWGLTAFILTLVASLAFDRLPDFQYQSWIFNYRSNYQMKQIHESFIKSRL